MVSPVNIGQLVPGVPAKRRSHGYKIVVLLAQATNAYISCNGRILQSSPGYCKGCSRLKLKPASTALGHIVFAGKNLHCIDAVVVEL